MQLGTGILSHPCVSLLFFLHLTCLFSFPATAMAEEEAASNSLKKGESINLLVFGKSKTLVSANKRFELGFFNPDGKRTCWFLCIRYFNVQPLTFVWVANPRKPIGGRSGGQFSLLRNGSVSLRDGRGETSIFMAENSTVEDSETTLTLMNSGNLILTNDSSQTLLWQSFENPSDTFLPGMKMDGKMKLTSWEPKCDGNIYESFTLRLEENNEPVVKKQSSTTWKSPKAFYTSQKLPSPVYELLFNDSHVSSYISMHIVMSSKGEIQLWEMGMNQMTLVWWEPKNNCSKYGICGRYASCINENTQFLPCRCLPGFKPDESSDCSPLQPPCAVDGGRNDKFVKLRVRKVIKPDSPFDDAKDEPGCKQECMSKCTCKAYAFETVRRSTIDDGGGDSKSCLIWNNDITDMEEGSISDKVINVRVTTISRQCETCGNNLIPYPLSTASNCGDPIYSDFSCDISTDELKFMIGNSSFPITRIDGENRNFHLQFPDQGNCTNSMNSLQLPAGKKYHVSPDSCDISWDPAPEPTCNSDEDCRDWANSTCKNHNNNGQKMCICNMNYKWNGTSLICRQDGGNQPITIAKPSKSKIKMIAIIAAVSGILLLGFVAFLAYRRTISRRRRRRESDERLGRLYNTEKRVKDLMDTGEFNEEDKKGIEVPFFDLKVILEATNYFSDENKLGEGGFGPVYKGTFPGGQEIAVKRLSSKSVQGLEEFKNEVVLIAKLQHRNLVRLLGYCIKGDEKILLYEYMKNRSLDAFIFDRTLCLTIDWKKRFEIIMGIARGLLYLHQDSRLRIIHRDLKTSNILLDDEMNPKISDFGLARIVRGSETEANTMRIVGTYGYMSPEYALEGLFSIKSDVFSFGVIVLEIISGRRNTGFYNSQESLNLLGYAWKLWIEENTYGLMDQAISLESCHRGEVLRCVNVGLLCVQEDPGDRPNMSNVVFTLGNDTTTLPIPKQPAFVVKKWLREDESSSSSKPEIISGNKLTTTIMEEGR